MDDFKINCNNTYKKYKTIDLKEPSRIWIKTFNQKLNVKKTAILRNVTYCDVRVRQEKAQSVNLIPLGLFFVALKTAWVNIRSLARAELSITLCENFHLDLSDHYRSLGTEQLKNMH